MATFCSTRTHVSPQIEGGQDYDKSVDIWTLGVTQYHLLAGRLPGHEGYQLARILTYGQNFLPPNWSDEAKHLTLLMLHWNPPQRIEINAVLEHAWIVPQRCLVLLARSSRLQDSTTLPHRLRPQVPGKEDEAQASLRPVLLRFFTRNCRMKDPAKKPRGDLSPTAAVPVRANERRVVWRELL